MVTVLDHNDMFDLFNYFGIFEEGNYVGVEDMEMVFDGDGFVLRKLSFGLGG